MNVIKQNSPAIADLCQTHCVAQLFAFGSALRDDFNAASDVDFIVYFDHSKINGGYVNNYFHLRQSLENLLQRPVDLLEGQAIKNPYFKQTVDATKYLIYG
jgi:predicted nucleotidyltransferase